MYDMNDMNDIFKVTNELGFLVKFDEEQSKEKDYVSLISPEERVEVRKVVEAVRTLIEVHNKECKRCLSEMINKGLFTKNQIALYLAFSDNIDEIQGSLIILTTLMSDMGAQIFEHFFFNSKSYDDFIEEILAKKIAKKKLFPPLGI